MIYLDHAATTPLAPPVLEAMVPHFASAFGNASSAHGPGRQARHAVDAAREQVGALVGATPSRVVFTSGATESLNMALRGLMHGGSRERNVLIVSAVEHKAVLDTTEALAASLGVRVVTLPVGENGVVALSDIEGALKRFGEVALAVAVMAVNNETGALQPFAEVAELAAQHGVPYICDATQAAGWGLIEYDRLPGQVLLAGSAHKLHGPQGVGCLVVPSKRNRPPLAPLQTGGGHEEGLRSGTLNVPGIVGFGAAAQWCRRNDGDGRGTEALRDLLVDGLANAAGAHPTVLGRAAVAPHIASLTFPGADAEAVMANAPSLALASGSACTAAVPTPSHVLLAMGLDPVAAEQTVRLSLSRATTRDEVQQAIPQLTSAVARVRSFAEVSP